MRITVSLPTLGLTGAVSRVPVAVPISRVPFPFGPSSAAVDIVRVGFASIAPITRVRAVMLSGRGWTSKLKRGPPRPSSTVSSGANSTSPVTGSPFSNVPLLLLRSTSRNESLSPPFSTRMAACWRLTTSSRR